MSRGSEKVMEVMGGHRVGHGEVKGLSIKSIHTFLHKIVVQSFLISPNVSG